MNVERVLVKSMKMKNIFIKDTLSLETRQNLDLLFWFLILACIGLIVFFAYSHSLLLYLMLIILIIIIAFLVVNNNIALKETKERESKPKTPVQ